MKSMFLELRKEPSQFLYCDPSLVAVAFIC